MSQSIKLSDELYQELKGLADRECRTVPLMIQYMVQNWGAEKNKTENPAWDIPKPYCEIGSGSQANIQEPTAEHLGRCESGGRSYSELKAEKTKLIAEYQEKINYCQDYGERDRLQHELDKKLKPIQFEIDEMFRK